jgi:hypothetical protein
MAEMIPQSAAKERRSLKITLDNPNLIRYSVVAYGNSYSEAARHEKDTEGFSG